MPISIPNTTLQDDPDWTEWAGGDVIAGGFFVVANNPATVQMFVRAEGTLVGPGAELYLPPGTYPVLRGQRQPVAGLRAKNAVAGSPAQFFGVLYYPGEAQVQAGSAFDATVAPSGGVTPGGGGGLPSVGDFKLSAQLANHAQSGGGTWYLADGSAIPAAETALIALLGANLPDLRGRAPWALGTHVDVDAIGDNEGLALANRRPKHNTTLSDPGHSHGYTLAQTSAFQTDNPPGFFPLTDLVGATTGSSTTGITAQAAGGSGGADQPSFGVAGRPFYYGSGS